MPLMRLRKLYSKKGQYTLRLQVHECKPVGNLLLRAVFNVFQGKKGKEDFFTGHVFK